MRSLDARETPARRRELAEGLAQAHRLLARYRAHGLLGASGNQELWVGGTGYAAEREKLERNLSGIQDLDRVPDAVFLPVDAPAYLEASRGVMDVLRSFPAVVQVLGWDEAFMGVNALDPEALAHGVQTRVLEQTKLWCSIGVGDSKHRAKLASGFAKPRGSSNRRLSARPSSGVAPRSCAAGSPSWDRTVTISSSSSIARTAAAPA